MHFRPWPGVVALALVAMSSLLVRPAQGTTGGAGTAEFRIKIPSEAPTGAANVRRGRPLFISPSTASASVTTDDRTFVFANVTAAGYIYLKIVVDAGTHTFVVSTYDRPNAKGNVLSTGTTAPVVVRSGGVTQTNITLGGVVARVILGLSSAHATVGSPVTIGLRVDAQDADGNSFLDGTYLAGTTPFARPFTLTTSDPADGKLSQTLVTTPPTGLTIAYDGANVGHITFSASGSGITSVQNATLVPLSAPPAGTQLIATSAKLNTAYATGVDQILTTFGVPPVQPFSSYVRSAVDTSTQRVYVAANEMQGNSGTRFDVYGVASKDAFPLVESFAAPLDPTDDIENVTGLAIDSVDHVLYYSTIFDGPNVFTLATSAGHAPLETISTGFGFGTFGASLAVDPNAHRLFATVAYTETDHSAIESGMLAAFDTRPPHERRVLARGMYVDVTVDAVAGKVYAVETSPGHSASYVRVYDTTTLQRVGSIGPFSFAHFPYAIAADATTHRLFVLLENQRAEPGSVSPIDIYDTGSGTTYPLLGSFTTTNDPYAFLTVAPYHP